MARGAVGTNRRATITVDVFDQGGRPRPVQAIIDTGFDGALTLPPELIEQFGLPRAGMRVFMVASGERHRFTAHRAWISWHGRRREIHVWATDTQPLLGMALLWGSRVTFDAVEGGQLSIDELAAAP